MPVLHVVVPFYNEPDTLEPCLRRVLAVAWPEGWTARVYLVDDHSAAPAAPAAAALVDTLVDEGHAVALTRHEVNTGKGAALQTGFDTILALTSSTPDLVTIQDADLEYDPEDLPALMRPILAGETRAVLGTRWGPHTPLPGLARKIHAFGNRTLTRMSNLMTGVRVRDMECCYKMVTRDLLARLRPMLTEQRFGIEPQIVAGLARLGERVVEVPVRYEPRGVTAGKKIGVRDGFRAIYVIARERLRRPSPASTPSPGADVTPAAAPPEPEDDSEASPPPARARTPRTKPITGAATDRTAGRG